MPPRRPCLGPAPGHPCPTRALVLPSASRCGSCHNANRRARRNPGYDDPAYRRARRRKVGRRCELCGQAIAVTVHHRDGNPQNNTPANLAGACQDCADRADRQMRAARRAARAR